MARGRYTIVGKLADGGMAEIFLARQHGVEGFQKPVVLKRVLSAFSADPQFRNMFIDEAHISMSLSHGNIVQVLDAGLSGDRMFMVLELVEGWDLEQVIERAQAVGPAHPWPPSLALFVAGQVCRALSYAHGKRGPDGRALGIVHRDVSPTNVLLSEQGEVKLTDFGIAKAERKREQTAAGVIKGKIGFMSPEQALGQPLDARADLFSLGTVMYLMLTGRKPFEANSDLESLMRAQKANYQPPEQLNPYLSPDTTAIVNKAMRREASARYQTADEMLEDIERVLRTRYHAAGQTELKVWLTELGRHDKQAPTGRPADTTDVDAGRPVFVDVAGELSAGSSLELSDIDAHSAPTSVSLPIAGAGMQTPAPSRLSGSGAVGAVTSTNSDARVATPVTPTSSSAPATVPNPAPPTDAVPNALPRNPTAGVVVAGRHSRKGRAGLGFVAGAVCMLGAVLAIRWLATWAGQESVAIRPIPRESVDVGARSREDAQSPSAQTSQTESSPSVRGDANGASEGNADTSDRHDGASASPRADSVKPNDTAMALEKSHPVTGADASTAPTGADESAGEVKVGAHEDKIALESDDEETALLKQGVSAATTVIGDDDAEKEDDDRGAGTATPGAATENANGGANNTSDTKKAVAAKAAPGGSKTTAGANSPAANKSGKSGAHAASSHSSSAAPAKPVSVRITSSPLGAVVRTKKQVLGRTPISIRFNPGNTYALTFVKAGYVTLSRPIAVKPGKPASVTVALKKKTASTSSRGFFRGR